MFKSLHNNKLTLFFLAMVITFLSCDGRDRVHKTNAQVLTKNNILETFNEQIKFVPETKVEIVTDTILSNGFQIKIHYNSIEQGSVLNTKKTKNISTTKTHYKNFEAKLHILKDGVTINQTVINKSLFNTFKNPSFCSTTKTHYKNFEAKLHILKDGLTINQTVINKSLFNAFKNPSFCEAAIMQHVWIDYETSTKHELYLNTAFNIPNTETYKDFVLKIDEHGTIQIKEKNRSANTI